jgi:hypothetical protein
MEWMFSWEVTSVFVSLLIGIALAVLALDEFRAAKIFFSLAALDAIGGLVMWGSTTSIRPSLSTAFVFLLVGGAGVALLQTIRWVDRKREVKEVTPVVEKGEQPRSLEIPKPQRQPVRPAAHREVSPNLPAAQVQPEPPNRAWMTLKLTPLSPLSYDKDGSVKIAILFQYRNVGQSPAQDVWFFPEMFAYNGKLNPIDERDRFCTETVMHPLRKTLGKTIFPGDGGAANFTFGLSKKDIDAALASFDGHLLPLGIIACVAYTVPGSSQSHYTALMLDIHTRSSQIPSGIVPPPYEDIPVSDLLLLDSPIGGGVTSK